MIKSGSLGKLAQSVRLPAGIVHIAFPLLCWALVVLRWCNVFFIGPWTAAVIVLYYVLAAAYLFFTFITGMRVITIIGLFLTLAAFLFVWIPYNWVLAILMVPAVFRASYSRDTRGTAVVLTILTCVVILFIISLSHGGLTPEQIAYHPSPDGSYAAIEHEYQIVFFGGTDVLLCRACGPLLIKERTLYLGNHDDFGRKIEWLNESTIIIYGEKMDVFKDPVIERYDYF